MQNLYKNTHLGQKIAAPNKYTKDILTKIPRQKPAFENLKYANNYFGKDFWCAYEFSWLDSYGVPKRGILQFSIYVNSPFIVESKSLKLYLNSFDFHKVISKEEVEKIIKKDLEDLLETQVELKIESLEKTKQKIKNIKGKSLDDLTLAIDSFSYDPKVLLNGKTYKKQILYTHLFRSLCPVTNQPDYASVIIKYQGIAIEPENLLKYLLGFRAKNGFHETCVDTIFCDLLENCKPDKLLVFARFTRRGGIDINPYRANYKAKFQNLRIVCQ